jgi:uncharacterized membrane protein YkvA (DUF1232 family)
MTMRASRKPMGTAILRKFKSKAAALKLDIFVLYLAARDPRTPWAAKAIVACIVAYALSPIDLIPDPIPVLGYVDDLILLPLGIYLALKIIPREVLADCRVLATTRKESLARRWRAAMVIIVLWLLTAIFVGTSLVAMVVSDN